MDKKKYDLETLRKKCGSETSNIGLGKHQLKFIFQQYDVEKDRAEVAERSLAGLQQGLRELAVELEKWAGCPMGVQIIPMDLVQCDSCSKKGVDVVNCWLRYGQSFLPEAPNA